LTHVARGPVDPLHAAQWKLDLPASHDKLDAARRPPAHVDFLASHDATVGAVPRLCCALT
jgi:hypothetical protein